VAGAFVAGFLVLLLGMPEPLTAHKPRQPPTVKAVCVAMQPMEKADMIKPAK